MLEEIRIRGLGVIDEAHLEIGPGLTVLTGETGAGKTMVLTALSMVLGEKVEASLLRSGSDRAAAAATFRADAELLARASEEYGADIDDGLVLARMLNSDGRTRALLGGASVPASILSEVGAHLVSIHGQGSVGRLLRPSAQRDLLDHFAGEKVLALREEHRRTYLHLRDIDATIESLTGDKRQIELEASRLRELVLDFEKVTPTSHEVSELQGEITRLSAGDAILLAASKAREALDSEDRSGVLTLFSSSIKSLEPVEEFDAEIARVRSELIDLLARSEEVGRDLARLIDGLDGDPKQLELLNGRLADIQALLRRHGHDGNDEGLEEFIARYSAAGLRLLEIDGGDDRLRVLYEERQKVSDRRHVLAEALTSLRTEAAIELSKLVTSEVNSLAMPHAVFNASIKPADVGPFGCDDVEFLLAASPTATAVPLAKGASGGELSRVMLALEVVVAGTDPVPTYVFDEVDAGVGGAAALEIGKRLARLALHAQVIVVTHLAQVAAFATSHFTVTKGSDGSVTSSTVERLDRTGQGIELARMMAGLASSERAQASGEELLEIADSFRSGIGQE
jgi:DNA repair protein RecN (Recombination protein N)